MKDMLNKRGIGYKKKIFSLRFKNKKRKIISMISILFFIILVLVFSINFFEIFGFQESSEGEVLPQCGDGTFYNKCSLDEPYFCSNGTLIGKSSMCGCPEGFVKKGESCTSEYLKEPKKITLNYTFKGEQRKMELSVYKEFVDYLSKLPDFIYYSKGEKPLRRNFKLRKIEEETQRELILSLVKKIQNLVPDSKVDQARIAISIVQNIPWGSSGETNSWGENTIDKTRYPYTVLYDLKGVCGEKSELLALLLKEIGYGTAIIYYSEENHEVLGIKCPVEESLNQSGYCFVETSGPAIITDSSIRYVGGINLESNPEILVLTRGISLPKGLEEYEDAEKMRKINEGFKEKGAINLLSKLELDRLGEKYGLIRSYNMN